ncbi:MAG: nitroreductase [Henriciella sp.]|nr:nitroreductase [Henriciella sp.]MBO6695007.1 nitroreductase [Henriciella sp.]
MTALFPSAPPFGTPMLPVRPSPDARQLIALRRSVSKRGLMAPGPDATTLDELLTVAARVPDHRRLAPWRFLVFEGDAREAFNQRAVEIQKREDPDASEIMLTDTAGYFTRAPVVVAVISSPDPTHKTPVWEQELSCGALCQNLLLAANASGWAGCWLTEWIAFSAGINSLLGLTETERIAGYIYLGTAKDTPQERMRPDTASKIKRWQA